MEVIAEGCASKKYETANIYPGVTSCMTWSVLAGERLYGMHANRPGVESGKQTGIQLARHVRTLIGITEVRKVIIVGALSYWTSAEKDAVTAILVPDEAWRTTPGNVLQFEWAGGGQLIVDSVNKVIKKPTGKIDLDTLLETPA